MRRQAGDRRLPQGSAAGGGAIEYVGRFAPSPTGDLHFGSLVTALGSCLEARSHDGRWLIRIEDLDPPRVVDGSAERILADLERLGFEWDGAVIRQGDRAPVHQRTIDRLLAEGRAFWCGCARSDLPPGGAYPGTCRTGIPGGRDRRTVRFTVGPGRVDIDDAVQGPFQQDVSATVGDFVIRRADGLAAYQLAVVVDDAWQNVSEVIRGADLLDSTPRQVLLQRALGLPTPRYAHLPLVMGRDGYKLSKRLRADPVRALPAAEALAGALNVLGQRPPTGMGVGELWQWAREHWSLERVYSDATEARGAPPQPS